MDKNTTHTATPQAPNGFVIPLKKGPFQNNGASPWYAELGVGSPAQMLKFSFDTGSNFNWVTSSLCGKEGCIHYGGEQFDFSLSHTFAWLNHQSITVDFGPWGAMQVGSGYDNIILNDTTTSVAIPSDIYLSQKYTGSQFAELDWDGGIGLPSYSYQPISDPSRLKTYRGNHCERQADFHFMRSLLQKNIISTAYPYVSFETDPLTKQGKAIFGQLDAAYADSKEYLFLPWNRYAANEAVASLYYIWTTPLTSMSIGTYPLCRADKTDKYWFCLDSGSSQFKGDTDIMFHAYQRATLLKEDVTICTPKNSLSEEGTLVIPASLYSVKIEAGEFEGHQVPQFEPMEGLDNLVLVGSVLMDSLYTVYEYQINTELRLEPVGMWIFNKKDGPKIIQTQQPTTAAIFNNVRCSMPLTLNGRWVNSYNSQMDLITEPTGEIFGTYSSTTGASGSYLVYGYCSPNNPTNGQGQPVALSITWRPFDSQTENDSWHWVSTYCGQLLLSSDGDHASNHYELSVVNSLVATTPYDGAALGSYIDKLSFYKKTDSGKYSPEHIREMFLSDSDIENPVNGTWADEDNALRLKLSVVNEKSGLLRAELIQDKQNISLKGFTDTLPLASTERQSITLSGMRQGNTDTPISLSGYLNRQNEQLVLTYWSACGTSEENTYLQTNACNTLFHREQL